MYRFFKTSFLVSLVSILGLVVSLLNQLLIAHFFGISENLDVYFSSVAIPFMISGILQVVISSVLIPTLKELNKIKEEFYNLLVIFFFISILIFFVGMLFSILSLTLIDVHGRIFLYLTISLLMWIIVSLNFVNGYVTSLLNIKSIFVFPALYSTFGFSFSILFIVTTGKLIGIISIVLGMLVGFFIGFLLNFFYLKLSYKIDLVNIKKFFSKERVIKDLRMYTSLLKNISKNSFSYLTFTSLPFSDAIWISNLLNSGSLSYISYANRISTAIVSFSMNGIYQVILPYFVIDLKKDKKIFLYRFFLTLIVLFLVLILIYIVFLYKIDFILRVLFLHGKFTENDLIMLKYILPTYLIGSIFMAFSNITLRAIHAMELFSIGMFLGIIFALFYFIIEGILLFLYKDLIVVSISYIILWFAYFFSCLLFILKNLSRV